MAEAENLRKRYGEKPAADSRDLVVQPGLVLGLNGAGNG